MPSKPPGQPPPPRNRRWYQFGLATMLLVMLLISVLMSTWSGLVRGEVYPYAIVIALPLGMMILVSLFRSALQLLRKVRRRDRNGA